MYQGDPVGLQLIGEERGRREGRDGTRQVMQDLVGLGEDLGSPVSPESAVGATRAGGIRAMCADSGAHRCRLTAGVGGQTVGMRAEGAVMIKVGAGPG